MKVRTTIAACALAVGGLTVTAPPAAACVGKVCDTINQVCSTVLHVYCLR